MFIDLCQSMCSCSCHHHEENETSYAVWLSCSKCLLIILCLSDWFASHRTLCSQGWFVQVNQRVLKHRINIMDTAHPRGVASHPIHPPWISQWDETQAYLTTSVYILATAAFCCSYKLALVVLTAHWHYITLLNSIGTNYIWVVSHNHFNSWSVIFQRTSILL